MKYPNFLPVLIILVVLIGCTSYYTTDKSGSMRPGENVGIVTQIGYSNSIQYGKGALPLSGLTICVDPGHGGQSIYQGTGVYTGGTKGVDSGMFESEANLNVGMVLKDNLEEVGAKVVMTRTLDLRVSGPDGTKDEELKRRAETAEGNRAHMIISIHHNYAANPEVSGPSIYYYPRENELKLGLARAIHEENLKVMPGTNRGIHSKGFTVLASTGIPAVIIEFGFMSNPEFDKMLQDVNCRYIQAEAVYQGVLKYLETHRKELESFHDRYYDPDREPSPTVSTRFGKKQE